MKKSILTTIALILALVANSQRISPPQTISQIDHGQKEIRLPEPKSKGGKPLMDCLKERKTIREFSDKELDLQVLSDLLWASNGITREDGRRTAPTARNAQDISIYVVTNKGIYRWESNKNLLILIKEGDFQKETGPQPFVPKAQWNIALVSDLSKYGGADNPSAIKYGAMSAGYVSQNMYLYCSSFELATVARGMFDPNVMKELLELKGEEVVMLVHSVGAIQ